MLSVARRAPMPTVLHVMRLIKQSRFQEARISRNFPAMLLFTQQMIIYEGAIIILMNYEQNAFNSKSIHN